MKCKQEKEEEEDKVRRVRDEGFGDQEFAWCYISRKGETGEGEEEEEGEMSKERGAEREDHLQQNHATKVWSWLASICSLGCVSCDHFIVM